MEMEWVFMTNSTLKQTSLASLGGIKRLGKKDFDY